jgi:hypothetical protein
MRNILEFLLARIIETKIELINFYNPTNFLVPGMPGIPYVYLDDYLIELKLEIDAIDLPIPRVFTEENSDKKKKLMITIVFNNKLKIG